MRIQCSCGAKYTFEPTPEMAERTVQFVCTQCGLDSSAAVTEMIRRELGLSAAAPPPPPAPAAPPPRDESLPVARLASAGPAPGTTAPRLQAARSAPAASTAAQAALQGMCFRHPGHLITEHCVVCNKPLCPQCMQLFGYVCSPYCRNKAENEGIEVPEYASQQLVAERRKWRKAGLIGAGIASVIVSLIGFWIWYAWIGQVPKPIFKVRFDDIAWSGHSQLCGKDQIVFLHGDTLARHDVRSKKEIWSRSLIDRKLIDAMVEEEMKAVKKLQAKAYLEAWDETPKTPSPEKLAKELIRSEAEEMKLYVAGSNIWVAIGDKFIHYDWNTGKPLQEVPMLAGFGEWTPRENELTMRTEKEDGQLVTTHFNLADGEMHEETISPPVKPIVVVTAGSPPPAGSRTMAAAARRTGPAGLPIGMPGADRGKALDPAKVAEQAGNLSTPAKLALPALLANAQNQERIMNELDDRHPSMNSEEDAEIHPRDFFNLIPSKYGYVQMAVHVLEEKIVIREAMKAAPKKSALDGNVNASSTFAVANEILNEMQRDRGGSTVKEDQSRYQVTLRRYDGQAEDWIGEVIGPPSLHPLKTVNVLASGTSLTVLDKMNKKLWQCATAYRVMGGSVAVNEDDPTRGEGPCVERGNRLYVFDAAVLTAFDLATGNVLWRVPSVGISAMFFDDKGMLYVNTTSADAETLKYSKQIDVTADTGPLVLKIDPKNGKILWASRICGAITYNSGQYLFSVSGKGQTYDEEENPYGSSGLTSPVFFAIRRINPSNGREKWIYTEPRVPWDVQFKGNYIHLVFKKEVEVLKFFSF